MDIQEDAFVKGMMGDIQPESLPIVYQDATGIMPYDDTSYVEMLPERVSWDKKAGVFVGETLNGNNIEFKLLGVMMIWAKWSEQVGSPEDVQVGAENNPGPGYQPGLRMLVEVEDLGYYHFDLFGIAFRAGQGMVKRAKLNDGIIRIVGSKPISTKYGVFQIPALAQVDNSGVYK